MRSSFYPNITNFSQHPWESHVLTKTYRKDDSVITQRPQSQQHIFFCASNLAFVHIHLHTYSAHKYIDDCNLNVCMCTPTMPIILHCVNAYTYTYIYIYMYAYAYTKRTCIYIYRHARVYINIYIHTCICFVMFVCAGTSPNHGVLSNKPDTIQDDDDDGCIQFPFRYVQIRLDTFRNYRFRYV